MRIIWFLPAGALALWLAPALSAGSFIVTSNASSGPGSLQQAAIDAAGEAGADTITFAPGFTGPINLLGLVGASAIRFDGAPGQDVSIDATGVPGGVTITGGAVSPGWRFFQIGSGSSLTLRGITLANGGGDSLSGGAIFNQGALMMTDCTLTGNIANGFGGAIHSTGGTVTLTHCAFTGNLSQTSSGGAISSSGSTLTMTLCTLTGNSAFQASGAIHSFDSTLTMTRSALSGNSSLVGGGGAIGSYGGMMTLTQCELSGNSSRDEGGGAIKNESPLLLTQCTFFGNSCSLGGGAIMNQTSGGIMALTQCTLSGNSSPGRGGAISNQGTVTLTNTIAAGNAPDNLSGNPIAALGANLTTGNPLLATLADNGGPTRTMALLPGSPALDGVPAEAIVPGVTTDQRGFPRQRDGDAIPGALPDIGAYEAQNAPYSLGFNFNGDAPRNLLPNDAAGAPTFAQTHWNNLRGDYDGTSTGNAPNAATKTDAYGARLPGLRLWWDSPNTFVVNSTVPTTSEQKLMWGYLDSNNTGVGRGASNLYLGTTAQPFFAVADLPVAVTIGGYKVVVYVDGDAFSGRTGEYWLTTNRKTNPSNVTGETDLTSHIFVRDSATFSGTYTGVPATATSAANAAVGNYVVFKNLLEPGFIVRTEEATTRAPLNAVQIVGNETIIVTTAADENDPNSTPLGGANTGISLREALRDAPDGAGIILDGALDGATIMLFAALGEIVLGKSVTIDTGTLANGVTVSGGHTSRLFSISAGTAVALRGLTLTGGNGAGAANSGSGGAIHNDGTLTLARCTLRENSSSGDSGAGGAIRSANRLSVSDCTFAMNTAPLSGGAVTLAAGSASAFANCTFAGNSQTDSTQGGGAVDYAIGASTATFAHCTFSGNACTGSEGGGGLRVKSVGLSLKNCIVAGNSPAGGLGTDLYTSSTLTFVGANIVPTTIGGGGALSGPARITTDPTLAPLGDYGGPTMTMALLPGSPARNTATVLSPPLTADQRGFPIVGTPDIGAYEAGTLGTNYSAFIYETLPASTAAQHDSSFDYDDDGRTNGDEWLALTSPNNGASFFRVTSALLSGETLTISFPSALGRNYTLQQSDAATTGSWAATPGQPTVTGTGSVRGFTFSADIPTVSRHFYRVQVGP